MICKIWGVKAHIKTGINTANIKKGLSNLLRYMDDAEKIHGSELDNPFESFQYDVDDLEEEIRYINTTENFYRIIDYMADKQKIKNTYISGYLCDPDCAIEQFMMTKLQNLERVHKSLEDDLGNQGYHIVQSFPDDLDISDEEVHQCGIELCQKLKVHQAVITSHLHPVYDENGQLKGKCKHNHILLNSHINPEFIDPERPERMKYNDCKRSYAQLQQWNDEIAVQHGLPIIITEDRENEYSWYASEMENINKSWMKSMKQDLQTAMDNTSNWDAYKIYLMDQGYEIKEGKYETYTAPDKKHKARGARLGKEFTKEYLLKYWSERRALDAILKAASNQRDDDFYEDTFQLDGIQMARLLSDKEHAYYTKIPRQNKIDGSSYEFKIPLKFNFQGTVAESYINNNLSYGIFNEHGHLIGKIYGAELKDVLYQKSMEQYLRFKYWEEEETKLTEQEEIKALLSKIKKDQEFSRPGWTNSKTKKPYRIGLYDSETGRQRSLLEHILIFAMVVINKEVPEFVLTDAQRNRIHQTDERLALIIAPTDFKQKKLIEAILIARDEGVKTPEELQEKMNSVGKNLQKAKTALQKNKDVYEKMKPIADALAIYNESKDFCEQLFSMKSGLKKNLLLRKNDELIQEYNNAKALLYQKNLINEEHQTDFYERFSYNQKQDKHLSEEVNALSEQYTRLKKLKYQIDLAMYKEF